ncbi:uncharacterized protein LOC109140823 [Tachysurus ichikawai]
MENYYERGMSLRKDLQECKSHHSEIGVERFGVEEGRGVKKPYTKNQRAVKIHNIRVELKTLKKQYKAAGKEECGPLEELRCILRKKLLTLRRAEQHRRRRRERARRKAAFIRNPFEFTKQLLGQKKGGRLVSSEEEINQHLSNTFSDPSREQEPRQCDALITPSEPVEAFDLREPLLKEKQVVQQMFMASLMPEDVQRSDIGQELVIG